LSQYECKTKSLRTTKMDNKISVLMTVHNCEKYVFDSIQSILSQTHINFELVIVDDLSEDKSKIIIESIEDKRIRFFKSTIKLGRTKALNYGLQKCNSKFIAIQDADDVSHINRLENCMKIFNENNNIGLISTSFNFINFAGEVEKMDNKLKKSRMKIDKLKYINFIPHSSIVFKRDHFDKNLFYDEKYLYAQDYNLILKFFKHSKIYLLNKDLVDIRRHSENMSNNKFYSKVRVKENLNLLIFSFKNFNFNFLETINASIVFLKNTIKLLYFSIFK